MVTHNTSCLKADQTVTDEHVSDITIVQIFSKFGDDCLAGTEPNAHTHHVLEHVMLSFLTIHCTMHFCTLV